MRSHVVTPEDVTESVALLRREFATTPGGAWDAPAGSLTWSCWETGEHLADDLFFYATQIAASEPPQDGVVPVVYRRDREGGPMNAIFAERPSGTAGLLQVIEVCGAFLASAVRAAPDDRRAHHVFGLTDATGFAAMGVVETLVHGHDLALGLGRSWTPPAELCARALARLFPAAPTGAEPWQTLLWATGRGSLPGQPDLSDGWRWDSRPAAER